MIERWKLREEMVQKRQGAVWKVGSNAGRSGYFKFATKEQAYYSGPLIANEWIAAKLAARLGLPAAELQLATVAGPDGVARTGVVSVSVQAREVVMWRQLPEEIRQRAKRHIKHVDLLRMVVVFDAWITNIDRAAGKNMMLYRNNPDEPYDWYLIDHGLTLYGSPHKWERHKWDEPYWQKLWKFYHVSEGMVRLTRRFAYLEPMIAKIEALGDEELTQLVHDVPHHVCSDAERAFILRLLIERKGQIRSIMRNWLAYKGEKEYRRK
ncbi:HipA family kinase [Brevibacillus fluminis]|uniref:HipA family kinase n=1 Tax=Brevibacillus fluminis TaxID=511487 RepID=UPI003F8BD90F